MFRTDLPFLVPFVGRQDCLLFLLQRKQISCPGGLQRKAVTNWGICVYVCVLFIFNKTLKKNL